MTIPLTGYSDRWTVRPGEAIAFHVHSTAPRYAAQLVRLRHGDENQAGPGFKETEVPSALDGEHDGAPRTIRKGSYGIIDIAGLLDGKRRFTVSAWIWPTLPGDGVQGLVSCWTPTVLAGFGLFLGADRRVEARVGGRVLRGQAALASREWVHVALTVDRDAGRIALTVTPGRWSPALPAAETVESPLGERDVVEAATLLLAAGWREDTPDGPRAAAGFNGKLARPEIAGIAAWDLAAEAGTVRLIDRGPAGRNGTTVNRPARLMTGPDWPRTEARDAIHFHDDDAGDVGWPVSHRLTIPDGLASGVYALRLTAGAVVDHLPFFVAPPRGRANAPLALLIPTMSYLAYSNESLEVASQAQLAPRQDMLLNVPGYRYVAENGLKSTYDSHRDGSGICHASRHRPIIDFRPRARCRTFDAPHQFAADLHLVDWLVERGIAFDVITDDLLHAEGASVLAPYRAVMTGSHPEYWTSPMMDGRDAWLAGGGRFMYLGGNGFYWVTGVAPDDPDVIEVRRYQGTRSWAGEPGEERLATTGERGGLWRDSGRPPQAVLGVGFAGQGFDRGVPYKRTEASFDPKYSWIFAGVEGELVGAVRSLVLGYGAAGFEVDRTDARRGTPPHTVVLASSLPFTDAYQATIEEQTASTPWTGGSVNRDMRGDMVFIPGPKGGAIFSTSSIAWCATLSAEGYASDTSRITENVIKAFLKDELPI